MTEALKARGETPFPEAGEGVYLRFTNKDLRLLQQTYGEQFISVAPNFFSAWDFDFADVVLKHGAKKDGAPFEVTMEGALDDYNVADVFKKLLDALYLSYHGSTFEEHLIKVQEILERQMREDPDFRPPLESLDGQSLTTSAAGLSKAESAPTSSGASAPARSANTRTKRSRKSSAKSG